MLGPTNIGIGKTPIAVEPRQARFGVDLGRALAVYNKTRIG